MSCLLPSPVRALLVEPCPWLRSKERDENRPSIGNDFIKTALRATLAVAGLFAFLNAPITFPAALLGGALLSIPATALAVGSALFVTGIVVAIASAASLAFAALAVGIGLAAAGWLTLNYHNIAPTPAFGLAEQYVIDPIANKYGDKVSDCFRA